MGAQHTPGPWLIDRSLRTAINAGPKHIAMVNFYNSVDSEMNVSGAEHEANVHLVAAAPDLLVALKELTEQAFMTMTGGYGHLIDNANEAIAKAEGRS